jgi:hypothetical protein
MEILGIQPVVEKGFEPLCDQLLFLQGISLRRYTTVFRDRDRIRTYDRQLRRLLLYPTELLDHKLKNIFRRLPLSYTIVIVYLLRPNAT